MKTPSRRPKADIIPPEALASEPQQTALLTVPGVLIAGRFQAKGKDLCDSQHSKHKEQVPLVSLIPHCGVGRLRQMPLQAEACVTEQPALGVHCFFSKHRASLCPTDKRSHTPHGCSLQTLWEMTQVMLGNARSLLGSHVDETSWVKFL